MNKSGNSSLRRKADAKGRSPENGRHVRFHLWMMDTGAFRDLSPHEVRLLLEVYSLYSGKNNGWVFLSRRNAARRCKMSKDTASKCFQSLIKHGFLIPTLAARRLLRSGFNPSTAALYASPAELPVGGDQ